MSAAPTVERPASAERVAELLVSASSVRPVGGATKLAWGAAAAPPELEISTRSLDAPIEHNVGDMTAVLGAGATLARVQEVFAGAGQRLSLDPPDGGGAATIGGIVATGDSGPLRHRYGAVRDLILGVRVALPDGTVARAGSNVIKNVAGYDLAKLMCGALGTLGVVCEVTMRLHPLPEQTVTAIGRGTEAATLARAAAAVARRPLELDCLDVRWSGPAAGGALLARAAGHAAPDAAASAAALMDEAGLETETTADDEAVWADQREGQRVGAEAAVVRVSALPHRLGDVLGACSSAIARVALGLAWVQIEPRPQELARLRERLAPAACVLLDGPEALRAAVDPWGVGDGGELSLARRVKLRFDPRGVCNPGRYIGGL
jgi:glycolate oxidase FAD binding subunit